MKRATRIPNRFITSIQSWPAKGLALFLALLALGSCEDEIALIGSKRPTSRFGVYFKEFDIPVTTVQSDSILSTVAVSPRLLCGNVVDDIFGKASSTAYLQFFPTLAYSSPKIIQTDRTNFTPTELTLTLILDYYIHGDTSDKVLEFSLHEIEESASFVRSKEYFTNSTVAYKPQALATATFDYKQTVIKDHIRRNRDDSTANNRYDTLKFTLPVDIDGYADHLLDSALAKGVYSFNSNNEWRLDVLQTDSVFRLAFPGLALVAAPSNDRILGFQINSSSMKLSYSYVLAGNTVNSTYSYTAYGLPTFSSVSYDRAGTQLADIGASSKYQDFNVPDDFCYLHAGTGLFAKLDFSAVHSYFDADPDTIKNVALNAAEIIIDVEPDADRHHLSIPAALYFRVVKRNNRFFEVPVLAGGNYDPQYANAYHCQTGSRNLDALSDNVNEGPVPLWYSKSSTTSRQEYSAYVTSFFHNFLKLPKGYEKIYHMGIVPIDAPYGKSLHGLSFKKDKVKLRVYYTKTL